MSKNEHDVELGNLICKFGDDKVLLDYLDEIVIPAFTDRSNVRDFKNTKYFFHDVELLELCDGDSRSFGIAGRIIKDTIIEREQVFENGVGLVKNSDSMRSSPSAIFLLILDSHRLVYVRETADAPSKEVFRATLLKFMRLAHTKYINELVKEAKEKKNNSRVSSDKFSKADLLNDHPSPRMELIPLTSGESIEKFINQYDKLVEIGIKFEDRNDELDTEPFFEMLQKKKEGLKSDVSVVKHINKAGLDISKAKEEVLQATKQGNQIVNLKGFDKIGDVLVGNNENFKIKKPLSNLSKKINEAAAQMFKSFRSIVNEGVISVPENSPESGKKLAYFPDKIRESKSAP